MPPSFKDVSISEGKILAHVDITMLQMCNSKMKTVDAFKSLFRRADERFHYISFTKPEGSMLGLLEFAWDALEA
jgi:hypothetical protein